MLSIRTPSPHTTLWADGLGTTGSPGLCRGSGWRIGSASRRGGRCGKVPLSSSTVWCEKDALSGIFSDALSRYGVTLNIGRGYDGWSSIKRAADRYYWRKDEGIDTTVLYFGDFDPSGEDMHRSLIERFATLGVCPEVPKVALTHEDAQVLPGDVTKADDSRAAAFVAKFGDLAVELDALPVDELRARIRRGVEEHINMDALS